MFSCTSANCFPFLCNIACQRLKMLETSGFLRFIDQHSLFSPAQQVLLAVSAGRDSVLMARYFKQCNFKFGIAHCNFKLRGREADDDEQFCLDLAAELDVPFYATAFDTANVAASNHISIQMAARDLRYQWLEEIRKAHSYEYIALAHHQNDSTETILLNLVRGTGISGLHGIVPKRNKLLRPLLFLNRTEIDEIVLKAELAYREDSSNKSAKYARNKIRLKVIPVLKQLNPQLEKTFADNAARFAELEVLLEAVIENLTKRIFLKTDAGYEISISELKKLNPLNTLLFGLMQPFGFRQSVLKNLVCSLDSQPGKVFKSASHQIFIDRDRLLLSENRPYPKADILINPETFSACWNGFNFEAGRMNAPGFEMTASKSVAHLNMDLLAFPLILRGWRSGDYFYPLGMKGRKKLSDYFIEQKIPLPRKEQIPVLQNGNGDILWVAGYRMDDRYKIIPGSKNIFKLEQLSGHGS